MESKFSRDLFHAFFIDFQIQYKDLNEIISGRCILLLLFEIRDVKKPLLKCIYLSIKEATKLE